ncbi:hypothetical protein, partial [Endozoicomonas sp. SESOKO1]|uniref:hypothetical protein n=1 Tax=Endozoicomonas sp. SESOKO1 TaxID=2828742 RepID=UPI002147555C
QGAVPPVKVRANNYVGKSNWSADGYMDGAIDDLAIFNEALDASQVSELYQANQLSDYIEPSDAGTASTTEEIVNTSTSSDQHQSAIATTADGDAMSVWLSESGGTYAIMGRQYPGGAEFKINTYNPTGSDSLSSPDIVVLENGYYAVTWDYKDASNNTPKIKIYDASGTVITNEFTAGSDEYLSSLTALSGNRFALLNIDPQDGHTVKVNIFDDSGNSITTFDAGTSNTWDFPRPAMTELDNGNYAIVWRKSTSGNNSARIRFFDSNGNPLVNELSFAGDAASTNHGLTVEALGNGQVVTVFQSGSDVYFQRWSDDGSTLGGAVRVHSTTGGTQHEQDIVLLADGSFFITWAGGAGQDAQGSGVYGRHFSADGVALSEEILINETTVGHQWDPQVVQLADGTLQVSWTSEQNGDKDIFT